MKKILIACVASVLVAGCAGPKVVTSLGGARNDNFRMLYYQSKGMGNAVQGVIDCKAAGDGALSQCKDLNVAFDEES